ncbi:ABC transporter permease family protein [Actinomadura algeriensis]|uniref:ABC-type glycerol-3-phosphate transport system permease component n=1 Tax=Actinomadura algeriensis TaxID=1679523 RepID=A0ABR9K249_9ACTN|nr:hypothetical protein [Actinomadura algeriensis]MBE1536930.1 ABC-type glycerol-3-phosphate transport system permease component [Actinomadura algeriensis]
MIDGAGHLRAFTKVVFPLLRPITGTVLILNALFVWNDFFTPLLYPGGSARKTVPVRIFALVGQYVSDYGLVFPDWSWDGPTTARSASTARSRLT